MQRGCGLVELPLTDAGQRQVADYYLLLAIHGVTLALSTLRDPQRFYPHAGTSLRRALNKVIFERLYVDADGVTGHVLKDELLPLVEDAHSLPAAVTCVPYPVAAWTGPPTKPAPP